MANYNKSFNFTNGIQVDTDKFVVNQAGLVGVGTTTPASYLDVYGGSNIRGDVTISGVTSSKHSYITGVSTFSDVHIGSGIKIQASSGILTATKFKGDGSELTGVFAVSASGWYFESGSPGVAYTTSKIGIGTTNAESFLQIGGDDADSNSELRLGKRVPASETAFPAIGQVTSNGTDNSLGLSARTPSGNILFYTGSGDWGGGSNEERLRISNDGNVGVGSTVPTVKLDVKGTTKTTNLDVTGVSTFNQDAKLVGVTTGRDVLWDTSDNALEFADDTKAKFGASDDLQIYTQAGGASCIHNSNTDLLISNNTFVGGDFQIRIQARNGENSILCHPDEYVRLFYDNTARLETTGSGVDITDTLNVAGVSTFVGNITASGDIDVDGHTELDNVNVSGVSTFAQNIQLVKSSDAVIAVGKSVSINGYGAQLRYGFGSGSFKYSDGESLDLVNYSPGSFNFISNPNLDGTNKDFQWMVGESSTPKMTLTGIGGSLGIGVTTPISALHVVGVSTFSGNSTITGDLSVRDDLTVTSGNLTVSSGHFSGTLRGSVANSSGTVILDPTEPLLKANSFTNSGVSTVGNLHAVGVVTTGGGARFGGEVGIGTTSARSVADFNASDLNDIFRYIIPPCVTTTQRNHLVKKVGVTTANLGEGALIYNTSLNKLQVYTGSAWETITSS